MAFPTANFSCTDLGHACSEPHDIEVGCSKVQLRPDQPPCYIFEAQVGDTYYEHRLTVGPVDGPVIQPTVEQLQRDVDAARELAANHAHARHLVETLESQIK